MVVDVVGTVVGVAMVELVTGAVLGRLLVDADVATPYPIRTTSAAAATGPIQRGPPLSWLVSVEARLPKALVSSSRISMISGGASPCRPVALTSRVSRIAGRSTRRALALSPPGC